MKLFNRRWRRSGVYGRDSRVKPSRYDDELREIPTTDSVLGAIRGVRRLEALHDDFSTPTSQPTSTLSLVSLTAHPVRPSSSASSRAHITIPASRAAHIVNDLEAEPFTTVFGAVPSRADPQDERRFAVYFSPTNASDYELTPLRCGTVEPRSFWEYDTSREVSASEARTNEPHQSTHRPEDVSSDDPPPRYTSLDPHPILGNQPRLRRRSTLEVLGAIRKEGLKATTGKMGKSMAKHVEDVGKIAKDVPLAVKEAQMKLSSKRAKSKIRWLEKRNYLSCQERFLTRELVG
ncbi:hypothetical protein TUN199_07967 [Pyrenophora tritici-repentis]|uniref:Uncharacterized protein n=2 Tax=Pyrenophora tritici-repentis TaxID=45151 RepID=A0A2W1CW14_9PLEO|nr:uncharacterized protein PTRG_09211 [Pyrenophora tritici-repentis Pt-1C-BFP]KAF7442147.1 hypothetical protein A1F99_130160 [Pyrenophora tritici-repentis]EDU42262.1 predicted protein [Pyrenophora tritici-repentis Pt-1C-BFP]KAI0574202.1 hypothetical protein Alg215_08721 [Pyrenophora tritici-repentis]KAI0609004.1 hypothetical protein TUN205_06748 [Pyrenophora tritici-repentis]KAI0620033.1 hypothetical protein TUN199_07967 [Pyrenophora tritici-repentis]